MTFGTVGATFGGVTFGTVGTTFGGVTFGTVGATFGTVKVMPATGGITFGTVFTDFAGKPLGASIGGATVAGMPVFGISGAPAIAVEVIGGLSGITVSGIVFPSEFGISGGTLDFIRGGTFAFLSGGTMNVLGGTISGIVNTVSVDVTNTEIDVSVINTSTNAIPVQYKTGWTDFGATSLKSHLEGVDGLKVDLGDAVIGGGGAGFTADQYWGVATAGTTKAYLGVTIDGFVRLPSSQIIESITSAVSVKGASDSLTSLPVGITLTGTLKDIKAVGISGACAATAGTAMSVALYGYAGDSGYAPIGMTGDALKVAVEGVGICLGTVNATISATEFGISGGTIDYIKGGVLDFISGTMDVLNIAGVTVVSDGTDGYLGVTLGTGLVSIVNPTGTPLEFHYVKNDGSAIDNSNFGIPVFGPTGSGSEDLPPISATFGRVIVMPATGGTTFGVVFTDNFGSLLGLSGTTVVGLPMFGVSGATAVGTTFGAVSLGTTVDDILNGLTLISDGTASWLGVTFTGTFTSSATVDLSEGVRLIGTTGATGGLPIYPVDYVGNTLTAGFSGNTFIGFPVLGIGGATAVGATFGTVKVMPATGGTTFGVVFTNNFGSLLGLSGATVVGLPMFGVSGATAVGITFSTAVVGIPGWSAAGEIDDTVNGLSFGPGGQVIVLHDGSVSIKGDASTTTGVGAIGVTLIGDLSITNDVTIKNPSGQVLGVSLGTLPAYVRPYTGGTTFGVVFTNSLGTALGLSGTEVVGLPMFGVSGATAVGVTFGPTTTTISFPATGITIASVTPTIGVTLTAHSFAADEGLPVYGVEGATAVAVSVIGGTVSGIFTTEPGGITVTGVSSGIPIFGVDGATAVGVTMGIVGVTFSGITFAGALGVTFTGVTLDKGGSVRVTNTVTVSGTVNIGNSPTVDLVAGLKENDLNAATAANGVIVTQKEGPRFARGLTLDNLFIGVTTDPISNVVGISGSQVYYLKTTPVCVTTDYTGTDRDGLVEGAPSVPLKQGLWVQLTKWDLISHVLVGYTAASEFEFERNAQVLTKSYEMAPVWAHSLDQFRRFPGYTGNNTPAYNHGEFFGDAANGASFGPITDGSASATYYPLAQKQFIGVVEKPSRIFIPCRDAGEVYIQVKGDYSTHAIGSGFWDWESGQWSATTLYERGYFASSFAGFTGSQPNLNADGSLASAGADYGGPNSFGASVWTPPPPSFNSGTAIAQILASYQNNPFIRVWGY